MTRDTSEAETPPTRWQRFKSWAGGLALVIAAVIAAFLLAEIGPVRDLSAQVDAARALHSWLIGFPIALLAAGGILMLGAQFLPAPRQQTPPSDETLDAAAVPMEYAEARGRLSRSMEMEATTGDLRQAWRRRSWRYSRKWRILFLMLLGGAILAVGMASLFILIGPAYIKVLAAGLAAYVALRILWEFSMG